MPFCLLVVSFLELGATRNGQLNLHHQQDHPQAVEAHDERQAREGQAEEGAEVMAECMRNTDLFCKECGTYRHCFASDDERPDRLVPRVERLASDIAVKRDGVWEMPR